MMKKTIVALMVLLVPTVTSAETSLDKLVKKYEQPTQQIQRDPQSQIRTLKSEVIDLKVERDSLQGQVRFLEQQLERRNATGPTASCGQGPCIPVDQVEREKILTHIVYSLSLYRLAETIDKLTPANDVEAHRRAQKIMANAIEDLRLLGFDTKDPSKFPNVDELVEQLNREHEAIHR
jgi:hypothetical protein